MELKVTRKTKAPVYSAGRFSIDGTEKYYSLEDTDRKLDDSMKVEDILAIKVFAKTAIPKGRYQVVVNYSDHFGKYMPLLIGVKGFDGVRIHSGNKPEDTEGCILIGLEDSSDGFMGDSRKAYTDLMLHINEVIKEEKIWITIE